MTSHRYEGPLIVENDDGWFPPDDLIAEVTAAAKAMGLISDWPVIWPSPNLAAHACLT